MTRGVCAAGHKAMYHDRLGRLPAAEFLGELDPRLGDVRRHDVYDKACTVRRARRAD